jgi:hypothetical protein
MFDLTEKGACELRVSSGLSWAFSELNINPDAVLYSEERKIGSGWSNSKSSSCGSVGKVHGPWGNDVKAVSKVFNVPASIFNCRVKWKSWAIHTRDNEEDALWINDKKVWSQNANCGSSAWAKGPTNTGCDHWNGRNSCYIEGDVVVPCYGDKLKVEFTSQIDQHANDEAWAFGSLKITPEETLMTEASAIGSGWSEGTTHNCGPAGPVHGPWGNNVKSISKTFEIPSGVYSCRVQWKSWSIHSRDGKPDSLHINDKEVWSLAARGSSCVHHKWSAEGPRDTGCPDWNGRGNCQYDGDVTVVCSNKMKVEFRSAIDQHRGDEAWAFGSLRITPVRL